MGASAWADEASLDPVGVFTWTNTPTITYDASATSWAINQGGITGGKIGKYAGPYAIVKFDASVISGKTLLSAKLDFDITAGAYNSSINIAQMSDASFDPATVTTESFDASATQFQSGDWSTKNTTTHFSYDVATRVEANNVIAFAIYTNTAREQTLKNVKLNLEYSAAAVEKFEYELNAVDESNTKIKTLVSGEEFEGKTVTAYFPYMFYEGDKLYTTASSPYSVEFDKDNKVKTVTYTEASNSIVAYMEGESVFTESGEDAVCSNGKWGHAEGKKTAVISTLPAGKYTATIYLKANGNRSIVLRNTANTDVETNVIASLPIDRNSAAGLYTSDEFLITKTTTIGFSGYTTNGSTNQSADIDYILITKTGEAPQYTYTANYYNSDNWENVYAYTFGDETMGEWPGTQLTATDGIYNVIFEAAAAPNNIIFNNGKDGDAKKQTADLAFEDGASYNSNGKLSIYTATFTTNCGWEKVYAYAWSGENGVNGKQLGEWPGTQITAEGGKYSVSVLANNAPEYIIFNNGEEGDAKKQTSDLVFEDGKAYSWNAYTVTFVKNNGWSNVYAYPFTNNAAVDKEWPGTLLSSETDTYSYTFTGIAAPEYIIFNNGNGGEGNQTEDLVFENGAIYNAGGVSTVTKTISAAGYATYCSAIALDFSSATGLTAYIAKKDDSNNVTFTTVTKVPANTGVLLKGNEGTYTINVTSDATDDVTGNVLKGVTAETTVEPGAFVLMNGTSGVGFYKTTKEFTVGANTAYIEALPNSEARSFIGFNFDDNTTTAIEGVATVKMNSDEIFNLQGQRVTKATKGLYIINGKKVMVK